MIFRAILAIVRFIAVWSDRTFFFLLCQSWFPTFKSCNCACPSGILVLYKHSLYLPLIPHPSLINSLIFTWLQRNYNLIIIFIFRNIKQLRRYSAMHVKWITTSNFHENHIIICISIINTDWRPKGVQLHFVIILA